MLFIEALTMKGKGNLVLTGPARRSDARVGAGAYSYAKSRAKELDIDEDDLQQLRHPHPHSRRRDSERRPFGRHHAGDGAGFGAFAAAQSAKTSR